MNAKNISFGCVALALLGLLLVVLPTGYQHWQVNHQLQTLRDAGEPTLINHLGDSAPVSVWPLDKQVDARTSILEILPEANALVVELKPVLNSDDFLDCKQPVSAQHLSVLKASFEKHPSVVPALRAASDCQRYAWPSPHTPQGVLTTDQYMKLLLKEISDLRMVGRLMICGARFLASKGQVDESAMLCVDLMRLTGLQETGPTVVVYQTNVAIRQSAVDQLNVILQESVLEPKTHAAIERVLAEHESSDAFVQALKTERAFGISSFQNMPSSVRWFSGSLPDYLDTMQAQIDLGKTPPHKILASAATSQFPLTQLSMQAVESCRNAFETDRIRLRCLRILNALRSKQIVACELPSECLGLAAEAIEDPYSGRSLNMDAVETADGIRWCIHSDGPNPFAVGEMARGLPNDKGNGRNPNAQNPYAQGENQRHQMDLSLSP